MTYNFPKSAIFTLLFSILLSSTIFGKGGEPKVPNKLTFSSLVENATFDAVPSELDKYIQLFMDCVDMDTSTLKELRVMDANGSNIMSLEYVAKNNKELNQLPTGNYNLVFEFATSSHDMILVKR